MDQADLRALPPLEAMAEILRSAPPMIARHLTDAEERLGPRLRRLERGAATARDDLASAERYLSEMSSRSSDEDDDGSALHAAERMVEEANERVRRIEWAMADVRTALGRYKVSARDLNAIRSGAIPKAERFLVEKLAAARAYLAVQVDMGSATASSHGSPAKGEKPTAATALESQQLPPGYFWLPLHEVASEDVLNDPTQWKKVSLDTMVAGVRQLYTELLPLLDKQPGLTSDVLMAMDRAEGRVTDTGLVHLESLANLHAIFFGSDPIAAELDPTGRWHVNGRHRVSVALMLGMTHIPARRQDRKS